MPTALDPRAVSQESVLVLGPDIPPPSATSATVNGTETLANPSGATVIFDSGRVNGAVSVPGEQTRYTFTLAQDTFLYFDALTNSSNFTWTLTGPPGTVVDARPFTNTDSFSATGNNPVLSLGAGAYTLTVDGVGDATGAYQFRLVDLKAAQPLTSSTPANGSLELPNETDLYRFDATAGDSFFFDMAATHNAGNTLWRLITPFGTDVSTLCRTQNLIGF
jgi:hypothetical protein